MMTAGVNHADTSSRDARCYFSVASENPAMNVQIHQQVFMCMDKS